MRRLLVLGLPAGGFGETRHRVSRIAVVQDVPLLPGIGVPKNAPPPAAAPPRQPDQPATPAVPSR